MFPISTQQLQNITQAYTQQNSNYTIDSVHIDSRLCPSSSSALFIAIKGNRQDGHNFIADLYARNVRVFVVDEIYNENPAFSDAIFLKVPSTILALHALAKWQRKQFTKPVIAITGSNGKTILKEWLAFILSSQIQICKNPKSYNSQLGVPLSVCQLNTEAEAGIFEAGISKPREMDKLQEMLTPDIGVFTNLGHSHQSNFSTLEEKLDEKLKLFSACETIIYNASNKLVNAKMHDLYSEKKLIAWSYNDTEQAITVDKMVLLSGTDICISTPESKQNFFIPYKDSASAENAVNAYLAALELGIPKALLIPQMNRLPAVEMRLNFVEGIFGSTIINDCYNSDLESIKIAIHALAEQDDTKRKKIILSDFEFPATKRHTAFTEIASILSTIHLDELIYIGLEAPASILNRDTPTKHYKSTEAFLNELNRQDFSNSYTLIKGSRQYGFERIVKQLEKHTHQTVLEVNLSAIASNLNYFKSKLKPQTKIMAMVKAFSYGSGDYEIAELMHQHKVDYLAVAFVDEGIALRQKGISTPIVVMNPEVENYATMLDHKLEPEIYSLNSLLRFIAETRYASTAEILPIHLKIDTGMHRLGMSSAQIPECISILQQHKNIRIQSVFSHLSGADDPQFDEFTHQQANELQQATEQFKLAFDYPILTHLLNSAGSERFPEYQFDMVRLGIGLYGISALPNVRLEHISSLKTNISQIRQVAEGETVGYSRKWQLNEPATVGVLPIGYADGFDRRFSNGTGQVLIGNSLAPIIGNVCMDACMVDLSGIQVQEGDTAIIFSADHPISLLADQIGTIPYEILTNISKRVKRIYYKE